MSRSILLAFSLLILISCSHEKIKYKHIIYNTGIINTEIIQHISAPEKALLCCYLYVYGNTCNDTLMTVKCNILKELKIKDEGMKEHRNFLQKWFVNDPIIYHKLNTYPALNSSIKNQIKKLVIERNADTLSIEIKVSGINMAQEKNWKIEQKDIFIVNNHSFIKLIN